MNSRFIISIALIFILGLPLTQSGAIPATAVEVSYKVLNSQTNPATWYEPNNSVKYTFTKNTLMNVTLFNPSQSFTNVTIQLGNLTKTADDAEANSALVLGYWKIGKELGFIANQTWDVTKQLISGLNSTVHSYEETTQSILGKPYTVVKIHIEDKFQNTQLTYQKNSGVLVYANTSSFGFWLNFEIFSIKGTISNFNTNQSPTPGLQTFIISLTMLSIIVYTKIRNHKKK